MDHVPFRVECVDDSIIPHAQPKTIMPLQAVMRKGFQQKSFILNPGMETANHAKYANKQSFLQVQPFTSRVTVCLTEPMPACPFTFAWFVYFAVTLLRFGFGLG